jgi:hypothetical protein
MSNFNRPRVKRRYLLQVSLAAVMVLAGCGDSSENNDDSEETVDRPRRIDMYDLSFAASLDSSDPQPDYFLRPEIPLEIIGGPEEVGGERWWRVEWTDKRGNLLVGWVKESDGRLIY